MNLQEATKRIHFQSTTEMKKYINLWHRAAGQLGGKRNSSMLPDPKYTLSFLQLTQIPQTISFHEPKGQFSLDMVSMGTLQSSTCINSFRLPTPYFMYKPSSKHTMVFNFNKMSQNMKMLNKFKHFKYIGIYTKRLRIEVSR